jgi:hypothetical protein
MSVCLIMDHPFLTYEGVELELHVFLASVVEYLWDSTSSNWYMLSNKGFVTINSLRSSLFCDVTHCRTVVIHRRLGTTCRSHFKGQQSRNIGKYQTTLRNIREEQRSHLYHSESLMSVVCYFVWWRKHYYCLVFGAFLSYSEGRVFDSRPNVFDIVTESFLVYFESVACSDWAMDGIAGKSYLVISPARGTGISTASAPTLGHTWTVIQRTREVKWPGHEAICPPRLYFVLD